MLAKLASVRKDDLRSAAHLLHTLPRLLRHPLTVDEALVSLRTRLERRDEDFISLVDHTVFANDVSPYRALFRAAGVERGDFAQLIRADGLDDALRQLYHAGVYLTVDEFKGRRPAVRGSATIEVDAERLYNPLMTAYLAVRSGGTTGGSSTMVPVGLESLREVAVNQCLSLHARGGLDWPQAIWGIPGGSSTRVVLRHAAFGRPPARWFSQVDPASPELHPRYLWSARVMRWAGLLAHMELPRPEYVSPEDPRRIVRWMSGLLRQGQVPHLRTFASAAVRVCQTAMAMGEDLEGAQFTLTGEPCTAARREAIARVGAQGVPNYATMEAGGPLSYGCLNPIAPDEFHLYRDTHALVQPGRDGGPGGLPARALLVTVLSPTSPVILINASAGDQAEIVDRECGCALEQLGWTTHFHSVRSFEKLTAGGMTFLDHDVIRVLEEVLPARFGGGPTDYQLVEGEDVDGAPCLRLLVSPALGPLDEVEIRTVFLDAIGSGVGVERVMRLNWEQGKLIHVERLAPRTTRTGKVLHLHLKSSDSGSE
jgi:hypothetical protein